MGCDCSYWTHSSLSLNTTTITMATNKRSRRSRPLTLAEAEAQCKGYMVARSRKRMKAGKPYDIIHIAPASQQAGPSFQSRFDDSTSQDGLLEQPPADGGMLEDHTTHFGPQDGQQKPGRARDAPFGLTSEVDSPTRPQATIRRRPCDCGSQAPGTFGRHRDSSEGRVGRSDPARDRSESSLTILYINRSVLRQSQALVTPQS